MQSEGRMYRGSRKVSVDPRVPAGQQSTGRPTLGLHYSSFTLHSTDRQLALYPYTYQWTNDHL